MARQYPGHAASHTIHPLRGMVVALRFHPYQAIRLRKFEGCSNAARARHLEIKNNTSPRPEHCHSRRRSEAAMSRRFDHDGFHSRPECSLLPN